MIIFPQPGCSIQRIERISSNTSKEEENNSDNLVLFQIKRKYEPKTSETNKTNNRPVLPSSDHTRCRSATI